MMNDYMEYHIDLSADPAMQLLALEGGDVITEGAKLLGKTRQIALQQEIEGGELRTGAGEQKPGVCRTYKIGSPEMAAYIRSLTK